MAIYSLNLASIGRTTHAAGTAGAHLRYIARADAEPVIQAHGMPEQPSAARAWMDSCERGDRKNARVIDKLRIALPRELGEQERGALVAQFMTELTGNKVPWFAAIHQTGKDAHNPHVHVAVRDRDIDTGKRTLKWSDSPRDRAKAGMLPSAVEMIREKWEIAANKALAKAGQDARIDRRTLEAQGVERAPTIHIGPRAAHVESQVERPASMERPQRKRRLKNSGYDRAEIADYPSIDVGRTRKERNVEIIDLNLERATRSKDFPTRERARFAREQMACDRQLESRLIVEARRRTLEQRRLAAQRRADTAEIKAVWRDERSEGLQRIKDRFRLLRQAQRAKHEQERAQLDRSQGRLSHRVLSFLDITGGTRRRDTDAKELLKQRHKSERRVLANNRREMAEKMISAVNAKHKPAIADIERGYAVRRLTMKERHQVAERDADAHRQDRARDREQAERRLEASLKRFAKRKDQEMDFGL